MHTQIPVTMSRSTAPLLCLATSLLLISSITSLLGQVRPSASPQSDCEVAAQSARTGAAGRARAAALHQLVGCRAESGDVLPATWRRGQTGGDELQWLVAASIATRDARILEAVMSVASNPNRETDERLAALRVLASYGDGRVWVSVEDLATRRAVVLPSTDHPAGRQGDMPLPADIRQRVLSTFESLGKTDPNEEIRTASRFLYKAFPKS